MPSWENGDARDKARSRGRARRNSRRGIGEVCMQCTWVGPDLGTVHCAEIGTTPGYQADARGSSRTSGMGLPTNFRRGPKPRGSHQQAAFPRAVHGASTRTTPTEGVEANQASVGSASYSCDGRSRHLGHRLHVRPVDEPPAVPAAGSDRRVHARTPRASSRSGMCQWGMRPPDVKIEVAMVAGWAVDPSHWAHEPDGQGMVMHR